MSQPATNKSFEEMRELYLKGEADLRKEPVKLTYWLRGGDPGEGFTSDMLELEMHPDRRVTGIYTKARFDLGYDPPYLAERFTAPVSDAEATSVLQRVMLSPLFTTEYSAERAPPIGDILKETWTLSRGDVRAEKTFYHDFPADFDEIRAEYRRIMQDLEQRGDREVLNRKRP
jgi:hypothetical protein